MANELQNRNNLFDSLMNMRNWMNDDFFSNLTPVADHMKTDVTEDDKNYTVKIDMPVTGHRDTFDDDGDKDGNVLHSERRYGQMSRQYRLPDVNKKDIKAQYKDGVLTITLPKMDETDDNENHIDIE